MLLTVQRPVREIQRGAGAMEHFETVFVEARVDGALAASVFHSAEIPIPELKHHLRSAGLNVRPALDAKG